MPFAIIRVATRLLACVAFLWMGGSAIAATLHNVTIWIPDYFGRQIFIDNFDYSTSPPTFSENVISVAAQSCNPNSVAVLRSQLFPIGFILELYVVCSSDSGGLDQILVYNATTMAFEKAITGVGIDGFPYFKDAGLIGVLFDSHQNLWVSAYRSNSLLRISDLGSYLVDRQVIDSPDSPVGMAMAGDGSVWVVGQFAEGIAVSFPDNVINAPGTFLHDNPLNLSPTSCISNAADGCQQVPGLFNSPEGVAVFAGSIWVSNNGGNTPGKTLVRLTIQGDGKTLSSSVYGGIVSDPFACPGGLFATTFTFSLPNRIHTEERLWVNDEGADVNGTDCGASAAYQGSQKGLVLTFRPHDLLLHQAVPTRSVFPNSDRLKASSPGFGGIFVREN